MRNIPLRCQQYELPLSAADGGKWEQAADRDWLPLDSSVFTSAAYVPAKRTLYLRFRSGEIYSYHDFPPQQYRDFLAADSKGQYFSSNIRDRFRYSHLATHAMAAQT